MANAEIERSRRQPRRVSRRDARSVRVRNSGASSRSQPSSRASCSRERSSLPPFIVISLVTSDGRAGEPLLMTKDGINTTSISLYLQNFHKEFQRGSLCRMDSAVVISIRMSTAQRRVLFTVKSSAEASADALAETLGTSPSAVRQHLAVLKSGGFVASRQEQGRSGRPVDLYHCTESGESLFAGTSALDLSIELLGLLEAEDPELVSRAFELSRRRRVEQCRDKLVGKSLREKVVGLAALLSDGGYMADVESIPQESYRLTLHSCAIWAIASRFGLACTTELEFMREILPEADVTRVAHKVAGAFVCAFEFRPRTQPQSLHLKDSSGLTSA
jgi:DeoR family suf operon transcriptional repressor